jgi:hypothetical protein
MFDGSDTAFYLAKGFRVVSVEARPDLCAQGRLRFADEPRRVVTTKNMLYVPIFELP